MCWCWILTRVRHWDTPSIISASATCSCYFLHSFYTCMLLKIFFYLLCYYYKFCFIGIIIAYKSWLSWVNNYTSPFLKRGGSGRDVWNFEYLYFCYFFSDSIFLRLQHVPRINSFFPTFNDASMDHQRLLQRYVILLFNDLLFLVRNILCKKKVCKISIQRCNLVSKISSNKGAIKLSTRTVCWHSFNLKE